LLMPQRAPRPTPRQAPEPDKPLRYVDRLDNRHNTGRNRLDFPQRTKAVTILAAAGRQSAFALDCVTRRRAHCLGSSEAGSACPRSPSRSALPPSLLRMPVIAASAAALPRWNPRSGREVAIRRATEVLRMTAPTTI